MLLENRSAIIHGAGGAIGGAVAHAFAREGAKVYLSGRNLGSIQAVAKDIIAAGGLAEAVQVDALDEQAVDRHTADVAEKAGGIDVCFNAIGFPAVQGTPLTELALEDFTFPITTWTSTQFLTARAAARHMAAKRKGVILTISASPARLAVAMTGGSASRARRSRGSRARSRRSLPHRAFASSACARIASVTAASVPIFQ